MIIRMQSPQAFGNPIVWEFFLEAAKENKFSNPEGVVRDLANMVAQPEMGCFVALGPKGPEAVVAMLLPQSAMMECPQVILIFGRNREATAECVREALKFGIEAGYNRGWGVNRSGRPDEAFERLFGGHVGFVRPIGTVMEYEV